MDKKALSERDIYTKFIAHANIKAGCESPYNILNIYKKEHLMKLREFLEVPIK